MGPRRSEDTSPAWNPDSRSPSLYFCFGIIPGQGIFLALQSGLLLVGFGHYIGAGAPCKANALPVVLE